LFFYKQYLVLPLYGRFYNQFSMPTNAQQPMLNAQFLFNQRRAALLSRNYHALGLVCGPGVEWEAGSEPMFIFKQLLIAPNP
jgi:hypothetical protein